MPQGRAPVLPVEERHLGPQRLHPLQVCRLRPPIPRHVSGGQRGLLHALQVAAATQQSQRRPNDEQDEQRYGRCGRTKLHEACPRRGLGGPLDQVAVWHDHVRKDILDEIAFGLQRRGGRFRPPGRQPKLSGDSLNDPVDRGAFLGAARQVEPAEDGRFLIGVGLKQLVYEGAKVFLHRRHLQRKDVHSAPVFPLHGTPEARGALVDQRFHHLLVLSFEGRPRIPALAHRQRSAPDLLPLLPRQLAEELSEALQQVALRKHEINREAHPQLFDELVDTPADVGGMPLDLLGRGLRQLANADAHDDAVDRAVGPVLFEGLQEGGPLLRILLVRHVAPGGIQQDGFVRKEPVAVARAAHAPHTVDAHREVKARVGDGRRLARAGRPHKEIPRQRIERGTPAASAQPGVFQLFDGGFEALLQLLNFGPAVGAGGHALLLGLLPDGLLDGIGAALCSQHVQQQRHHAQQQNHHQADEQGGCGPGKPQRGHDP